MKSERVSMRYIKSGIRDYFDREISSVNVPPVPVQSNVVFSRRSMEQPTGGSAARSGAGFSFFRAATAAVIIACSGALLLVPVKQNELVEIVGAISEREAFHETVISGLQKVGRFLHEEL